MRNVVDNIQVNKDGQLYCYQMPKKLKKRLVSGAKIEDTQNNGYSTVPVIIEELGIGIFKFTKQETNQLMNKIKEFRKENVAKQTRTTFRDELVVKPSKIDTTNYNQNNTPYNYYNHEER